MWRLLRWFANAIPYRTSLDTRRVSPPIRKTVGGDGLCIKKAYFKSPICCGYGGESGIFKVRHKNQQNQ